MPNPECMHALNFCKLYPLPIRRLRKNPPDHFWKIPAGHPLEKLAWHFWKISQLIQIKLTNHTKKAHLQNISSVLRFFMQVRWAVQTSTKPRPSKLPCSYLCLYAVIRRYTPLYPRAIRGPIRQLT